MHDFAWDNGALGSNVGVSFLSLKRVNGEGKGREVTESNLEKAIAPILVGAMAVFHDHGAALLRYGT